MNKSLLFFAAVFAIGFLPEAASANETEASTEASPTYDCELYNNRWLSNRVYIALIKCMGVEGSLGRPMYHAELFTNHPEDIVLIRYRTTNNNAELNSNKKVGTNLEQLQTKRYFANPDEVQACAYVTIYPYPVRFFCAWTRNDNDRPE